MFSARKTKAAPPRQQSVAPQIDRSTTESSMDDSSPRRRGDVALCCAYVLQGNDWAPVNNSRPDDLTNESRFLAAKIVQDDDMAEAFLELHDYPQTTIIELVVKLKAESRLVKLGGARNAKAHVYELERCCGPDVVALQFALDFAKLERKEIEPPFTPRAGRVPNVPDQALVKKFGPHRPSDGDSPQQKGGSDEVSLSFKGEQFQGFSVFASPAPPVRRKSSKDLK